MSVIGRQMQSSPSSPPFSQQPLWPALPTPSLLYMMVSTIKCLPGRFSLLHSLTNASNGAGGTVSDYGNAVKDWTGADGPRTATAKNPVGTTTNKEGGKKVVTGAAGTKAGGASTGKGTANNPLGLSK